MSNYQTASGGFKLSTREWPKFRTSLIKSINCFHKDVEQRAVNFAKEFNAKPKKVRLYSGTSYPKLPSGVEYPYDYRSHYSRAHVSELLEWSQDAGKYSVNKTKLKKQPTSKSFSLGYRDCSIELINKSRSVSIDVDYNNHSFDTFQDDPIADLLEMHLERVKWTRGTGGFIYFRSEYDEHNESTRLWCYGPRGNRS